jgi:hypothetical protein
MEPTHAPSLGADVAGVSPVPVQMWQGGEEPSPGAHVARSEPSPNADVGGDEPSPGALVAGGETSPSADVVVLSRVPGQMRQGCTPAMPRRSRCRARHVTHRFAASSAVPLLNHVSASSGSSRIDLHVSALPGLCAVEPGVTRSGAVSWRGRKATGHMRQSPRRAAQPSSRVSPGY